jgi:nitroreductase
MTTSDITTIEQFDYVLTTTRSVRKRLDLERSVPPQLISECIDLATQGPSSGNTCGIRFLVITDAVKRAALADIYRRSMAAIGPEVLAGAGLSYRILDFPKTDPRGARRKQIWKSSQHLEENLHRVPVMVIVCMEQRLTKEDVGIQEHPEFVYATYYGSVLPAMWSFMLGLRSRGLVSAYTTAHLMLADEVSTLLGIPESITQVAMLPVAYPLNGGNFQRAARPSGADITYWDQWGSQELEANPGDSDA